jgi:multicomponent Na+:H+ antiporter subunit D
VPSTPHKASDFVYASLSLLLALALAWAALFGDALRQRLPALATRAGTRSLAELRQLHSGHVGDYVAWLTFGLATLGGLFALTLR